MRMRVSLFAGILAIVFIAQPLMAAKTMPPYWVAVMVGGKSLSLDAESKPPASLPEPLKVVAPGEDLQLRGKVVGGRRAYMMWPNVYANIGPNTTIEVHGLDHMSFMVDNGSYRSTGDWTAQEEKYAWVCDKGSIRPILKNLEKVIWTAPMTPGTYSIRVTGSVSFHYIRTTPAGRTEKDEKSGMQKAEFKIKVDGNLAPVQNYKNSKREILKEFHNFPSGPTRGLKIKGYRLPSGSMNNIFSVYDDEFSDYVCGAWQGKVLRMLDKMRLGTPEERKFFDHLDYGPIQAYWGGHQAVVIYPKGTDWKKTGTVLDPWPSQFPETFTIKDWNERFKVGVGTSGVYEGLYPLTGGKSYPKPRLSIPKEHMTLLHRCTKEQHKQYRALETKEERQKFIDNLPANLRKSTAVVVHSPVRMLLEDQYGRRVGWQGNTFLHEIPGVEVDAFPEADGSTGLMLRLPLADYKVNIEATETGAFTLTRALPKEVTETPLTDVQNVQVDGGETFSLMLSPSNPNSQLVNDRGSKLPLKNVLKRDQPKPPVTAKPPSSSQSFPAVIVPSRQSPKSNGAWKTVVE